METKKTPKANLENKKVLFREIGLAVALLLAILSFEWKTYDKTIAVSGISDYKVIDDDFTPITQPDPPTPPEMPKMPLVSDVIEIVDNTEKIKDDWVLPTEDVKGLKTDIMEYKPRQVVEEAVDEVLPVAVVDEKPQFMGGDESEFTKWVFKNITYPDIAKENNIQGRVTCSFVVTAEGKVTDVQILRGVDSALDKEALRVISMSPKWTPGKHKGKPVRVKYTFPVIFQLK